MRPTRRSAALLILMTAFALAGAGCNNKNNAGTDGTATSTVSDSGAVATINGNAITQSEFYTQLQNYVPNQQTMNQSAGRAVLQQLIQNKLMELLATQQNVAPTDAEVETQFNNIKMVQDAQNVKPFDQILANAGMTAEQFKEARIRPQLAQLKLLSKGTTVSDAEIKAYYDLHKADQFTKPDRAHIKRIALATQPEAEQIYNQIKQGNKMFESFIAQSVVKQPVDADLPQWVPLNNPKTPQLAPLSKAITTASVGSTTPPIAFQNGWWLVKVIAKLPKEVLPLESVQSLIHYILMGQKVQGDAASVSNLQQQLRDFQTKADISITSPQYADLVTELKNPAPIPAQSQVPSFPAPRGPMPSAPTKK